MELHMVYIKNIYNYDIDYDHDYNYNYDIDFREINMLFAMHPVNVPIIAPTNNWNAVCFLY